MNINYNRKSYSGGFCGASQPLGGNHSFAAAGNTGNWCSDRYKNFGGRQQNRFYNTYAQSNNKMFNNSADNKFSESGMPSSTNGFVNNVRNICNRFLKPKLHYDFYSDHHRYYNPKYRNNYKLSNQTNTSGVGMATENSQPKKMTPDTTFLKTILLEMVEFNSVIDKKTDTNFVTIFSREEFPLPSETKQPTLKPTNDLTKHNHLKTKCSKISGKSNSREQSPFKGSTANFSPPIAKTPPNMKLKKKRQNSECDNDDSNFIALRDSNSSTNCSSTLSSLNKIECKTPSNDILPPGSYRNRNRQISECSDDSFVIFCAADEDAFSMIEFSDLVDDNDSDDSDESEDDSLETDDDSWIDSDEENCDTVDGIQPLVAHLKIHEYQQTQQLDSGFDEKEKDKKVEFNLKPEIHVMHTWDFAYRAARKGPWEEIARDRCRFNVRIENTEAILNPVLDSFHRQKIYNARFCDNKDDQIDLDQQYPIGQLSD